MARDAYRDMPRNINEPPQGSFAITPNDGADLPQIIRQITIGTAGGTIAWRNAAGEDQTTGPLPVGSHPMRAQRILATGTTATGLTGLV